MVGAVGAMLATRVRSAQSIATSGDQFTIDGVPYRIADVLAPSPYNLASDGEPYFEQSRQALSDLLRRENFDILEVGSQSRWRERFVRLLDRDTKEPIAKKLLTAGGVRVNPQTDDHALIDDYLAYESDARAHKAGLWRLSGYQIFNALDSLPAIGAFSLIEGIIREVSVRRSRVFMNFGDDFRDDFTISVLSGFARRLARDGFDLEALAGARVRVRGFVNRINGPSIELRHRAQLEIL